MPSLDLMRKKGHDLYVGDWKSMNIIPRVCYDGWWPGFFESAPSEYLPRNLRRAYTHDTVYGRDATVADLPKLIARFRKDLWVPTGERIGSEAVESFASNAMQALDKDFIRSAMGYLLSNPMPQVNCVHGNLFLSNCQILNDNVTLICAENTYGMDCAEFDLAHLAASQILRWDEGLFDEIRYEHTFTKTTIALMCGVVATYWEAKREEVRYRNMVKLLDAWWMESYHV